MVEQEGPKMCSLIVYMLHGGNCMIVLESMNRQTGKIKC